jgi:hypothetical protein
MKKLFLVAAFVMAISGMMMAQNWSSAVDVLGAHNNNGRGCAGCHAPHSGAYGGGHTVKSGTDTGSVALWGQDASPLYGKTLLFGTGGEYVEALPSTLSGTPSADVTGIMLCLSCHDGNVTPTNMMTNQSYEQRIGLLATQPAYGSTNIPTLLGNDGTGAGNYTNDHPVGQNAILSTSSANAWGLVWASSNKFTVTAGSNYAKFVSNYGDFQPAGMKANASAQPMVVCTTCHQQHNMTVFVASSSKPVSTASTGFYATYFFVAAPYNPLLTSNTGSTAPSATQFCRQCHFSEANEYNNTYSIATQYQ